MDLALNIILMIGPLAIGTSLSTLNIPLLQKVAVWIACIAVSICGVIREIREKKKEKIDAKLTEHSIWLQERQELRARGHLEAYINGLGDNPLLRDHFNIGQKYEEEFKFENAIIEYEKCLTHPGATEDNKVAAKILIGNCYYSISNLKEAQNHSASCLPKSR